MTPAQQKIVDSLVAEDFKVVEVSSDVVRLSKGADHRLVRANGEQKRANHYIGRRPRQ